MALAMAPMQRENLAVEHMRLWASDVRLDTGQPIEIEPFQAAFLADVFDGYPECWLIVPEENGKTTLMALLALYHTEHRRGAYVPVAASSREQSEILYKQGEGFVIRSPRLHQSVESDIAVIKGKRKTTVPRFTCLEGYRRINHVRGGRIQVFAADDRTGDGLIGTLFIVEELHRHRNMELYRTWAGKLRKRGAQIVVISTAGEPGSEFEVTRERIRQEASEVDRRPGYARFVSSSVVLHEYAVPEEADVTDMRTVKSANPFSRITEQTLSAKFASPTMTLTHWKRFVCNLPTRSDSAAITEAEWEDARTDERIPDGTHIWLGLDVAWKWDTTAAVPFWMPEPKRRHFGSASIVTPPRDGNSLHPDQIKRPIVEIHERTPIDTVVMDTSDAKDIAAWLEDELGVTVIDRGQSSPPAVEEFDALMEALRNGWIEHEGDAGLTRHALNAIARMLPRGDHVFDRPSDVRISGMQERRVIDALKAASMVHAQATATAVDAPSAYEERGLVAV